MRWHRAGFRHYWRWKSRSLGGRPQIDADLRALIRRMSVDNPLWGAPRIHGEGGVLSCGVAMGVTLLAPAWADDRLADLARRFEDTHAEAWPRLATSDA